MSYTCPIHGWQHLLQPCPACSQVSGLPPIGSAIYGGKLTPENIAGALPTKPREFLVVYDNYERQHVEIPDQYMGKQGTTRYSEAFKVVEASAYDAVVAELSRAEAQNKRLRVDSKLTALNELREQYAGICTERDALKAELAELKAEPHAYKAPTTGWYSGPILMRELEDGSLVDEQTGEVVMRAQRRDL